MAPTFQLCLNSEWLYSVRMIISLTLLFSEESTSFQQPAKIIVSSNLMLLDFEQAKRLSFSCPNGQGIFREDCSEEIQCCEIWIQSNINLILSQIIIRQKRQWIRLVKLHYMYLLCKGQGWKVFNCTLFKPSKLIFINRTQTFLCTTCCIPLHPWLPVSVSLSTYFDTVWTTKLTETTDTTVINTNQIKLRYT